MQLAMQNPRFKKSRFKEGKSSIPVKERPGLGAPAARFVIFNVIVCFCHMYGVLCNFVIPLDFNFTSELEK